MTEEVQQKILEKITDLEVSLGKLDTLSQIGFTTTNNHLAKLNSKVAKNIEKIYGLEKNSEANTVALSRMYADIHDSKMQEGKRKWDIAMVLISLAISVSGSLILAGLVKAGILSL